MYLVHLLTQMIMFDAFRRPGGPDFYINKVDNVKAHGPGGQFQHVLGEEQGDSCFATIVSGREVLAKVYQQPTYNDRSEWHYFIEEPVEIKQAIVMGWAPEGNNDNSTDAGNRRPKRPLLAEQTPGIPDTEVTTIGADTTNVDVPNFVADNVQAAEKIDDSASATTSTTDNAAATKTSSEAEAAATNTGNDASTSATLDETKAATPVADEKDPVQLISEKLKRKPRLPKIHHQVDP